MRRIQFIELHEQPWFPSPLRDGMTDALQFGFRLVKAYAPIAPLLQKALDSTRSKSIVDICSGAGGPWLDLAKRLRYRERGSPVGFQINLTDKYPNLGAQNIRADSENHIAFYPDPVDATNVPSELRGFRTMFTSFHHFRPSDARAILQNAVDAGESIAIFEIPRRAASTIALTFGFVFLLFISTPWIRPFRWSCLFWTYIVPIIPLALLFDGVVSCLRTYRPQEMLEIVETLTNCEYRWETGEHSSPTGKLVVTYLIGHPSALDGEVIPEQDRNISIAEARL
jgi:hypothetical protein